VTRVMIASRSRAVRTGLETLVRSHAGLELAGSFADVSAADDLRPDVLLADLEVEDLPGGGPPVVLLSPEPQAALTVEAYRLGVRARLPRDAMPAAILAAIESAAVGLAVLEPRELEGLLNSGSAAPVAVDEDASPLTPRELEVLALLAEGTANKNIAWKLGISEHTVKFHVASILAKLGVGTRTEAVTAGIRKGLVLI
jgi:NarL family two-component system response regulator YdfI